MSAWDTEDRDAYLLAIACDNAAADTILHRAVREGGLILAERLLENGFLVYDINDEGQTALHIAASLGSIEACAIMLDYGADLFARPPNLKSVEASRSNTDADADADIHSEDNIWSSIPSKASSPQTPLDIAVERDDGPLIDYFLNDYSPPAESEDEETDRELRAALARALVANRTRAIAAFQAHGWTLLEQDTLTGRTLLHDVVQTAEDDIPVRILLEAGVDAAAAPVSGITAMHVAA